MESNKNIEESPGMMEIEILIENDTTLFSWNDDTIQEMAEDMGEPEFPTPRPCG